jgi:hypothetical protein
MVNKTKFGLVIHGLVAGSKIEDWRVVNICCEEDDNILHETAKQFMTIEYFIVTIS